MSVAIRHIEPLLAVSSLPANTVPCSIAGSLPQGSTLTLTAGTWTGLPVPTLAYQWRRAGVNIAGATATTYQTVNADVGQVIDVVETATNTVGAVAQPSSNTKTPTTAGFHSGSLTGYTVMVADIVAEWKTTGTLVADADALLLLLSD